MVRLCWKNFKHLIQMGAKFKGVSCEGYHHLFVVDAHCPIMCRIEVLDPASADQLDYENNFKSQALPIGIS